MLAGSSSKKGATTAGLVEDFTLAERWQLTRGTKEGMQPHWFLLENEDPFGETPNPPHLNLKLHCLQQPC